MSILSNIEETIAGLFTSGDLAAKFTQILELALLKACEDLEAKAKAGTLPDLLKPYSSILVFVADAAEEVLKPKA